MPGALAEAGYELTLAGSGTYANEPTGDYSYGSNQISYVWNFTKNKMKFQLIDQVVPAEMAAGDFCANLSDAYMDLNGEIHIGRRFTQGMINQEIVLSNGNITESYTKKLQKKFPGFKVSQP